MNSFGRFVASHTGRFNCWLDLSTACVGSILSNCLDMKVANA